MHSRSSRDVRHSNLVVHIFWSNDKHSHSTNPSLQRAKGTPGENRQSHFHFDESKPKAIPPHSRFAMEPSLSSSTQSSNKAGISISRGIKSPSGPVIIRIKFY